MAPFTGAILTAGCVAVLARCTALPRESRSTPRLPGRPDTRHERGHYLHSPVLLVWAS